MTQPIKAWWFCKKRSLPNGDGRRIRVGKTHVHKGELIICNSGFHASRQILDALQYAPGSLLARVTCAGEIFEQDDKLVCTRRTYITIADATDMLRHFARLCALDVVHLWNAPEIVKRYLRTGDKSIRAAVQDIFFGGKWDAAQDATWHAICDTAHIASQAVWAAGDAACAVVSAAKGIAEKSAAGNAAQDKQRKRLHRMGLDLIRKQI